MAGSSQQSGGGGGSGSNLPNFLQQQGYVSGYKEAGRHQKAAPTGKVVSTVEGQFKSYASMGHGTEATTRDLLQWMTDAGVFKGSNKCTRQNLDNAIAEIKPVDRTTIISGNMGTLISRIAVQYAQDHSMTQKKAVSTLRSMLAATKKEVPGTKSMSSKGTAGSITDKLTDSSLYTGAHKDRFDGSGQGRGIAGRTDKDTRSTGTGYVGNYKGAGTYDGKH